jgi:hypothetical protein
MYRSTNFKYAYTSLLFPLVTEILLICQAQKQLILYTMARKLFLKKGDTNICQVTGLDLRYIRTYVL